MLPATASYRSAPTAHVRRNDGRPRCGRDVRQFADGVAGRPRGPGDSAAEARIGALSRTRRPRLRPGPWTRAFIGIRCQGPRRRSLSEVATSWRSLVHRRRDRRAAKRCFWKLLKGMNPVGHLTAQSADNQAEVTDQPVVSLLATPGHGSGSGDQGPRSASIGSTSAARNAGRKLASNPASTSKAGTAK